MKNLELISKLLHMPMDADVIFRAHVAAGGSTDVEFDVDDVVQSGEFPPNRYVVLLPELNMPAKVEPVTRQVH